MSTNKKLVFRVADDDYGQNNNIKESKKIISESDEFVKFIYTAGDMNGVTSVLYSDKLIKKETKVKIHEIIFKSVKTVSFNGIQCNSISVYYGRKNVALLVEFEINSSKEWFVREDEVGIYWVHKKFGYEEKTGLENKLRQIESNIKGKISYLLDKKSNYSEYVEISNDCIYDEFARYTHRIVNKTFNTSLLLYKGAPLECMKSNVLEKITEIQNQAYETVSVYFGTKLKNENDYPLIIKLTGSQNNFNQYYINKTYNLKSYWDKIDELSTENEDKQLINQLKRAQFDLFDSILIPIDAQKDSRYDATQFSQVISEMKINAVKGKNVNVTNIDNCNLLKSQNFIVYKHDISNSVVSYEYGSETMFGLRFFLRIGPNDCSEIELYKANVEYVNREYIYHVKNKNTVSVFFYNMDPRPLLFCYNGQVFRPYSLENYTKKWVTVQKVDNFSCDINTDNSKILDALLEVTYSVNLVEIDKGIEENCGRSTYITQKLNNSEKTEIKINVSCSNTGSYKRYTHEPAKPGYVLGEVSHRGNKVFENYKKYNESLSGKHKNKFPHKVSTYYHVNDNGYNCPLMVILEYESNIERDITNNTSEYYKLTTKKHSFSWTKIQDNGTDGIENKSDKEFLDGLKKFEEEMGQHPTQTYYESQSNVITKKLDEILQDLGINHTKKSDFYINYKDGRKYPGMPPSDKLNDSNSAAVAGTITTLSLAGAGGGFLFYKYQAIVMSFIRGLLH